LSTPYVRSVQEGTVQNPELEEPDFGPSEPDFGPSGPDFGPSEPDFGPLDRWGGRCSEFGENRTTNRHMHRESKPINLRYPPPEPTTKSFVVPEPTTKSFVVGG